MGNRYVVEYQYRDEWVEHSTYYSLKRAQDAAATYLPHVPTRIAVMLSGKVVQYL